jgi:RNA polymerase subunit RPABC4/transcription elongation factor Spt4
MHVCASSLVYKHYKTYQEILIVTLDDSAIARKIDVKINTWD